MALGSRADTSRSATMRSSVSGCVDWSTLPRESTMPDDPYNTMPSARPATSARMTETLCSIASAMSTVLACAAMSAFSGGRPLFEGMNSAVAPFQAIILAGSGWFESLQIMIPNVSPSIWNTGSRSPAA